MLIPGCRRKDTLWPSAASYLSLSGIFGVLTFAGDFEIECAYAFSLLAILTGDQTHRLGDKNAICFVAFASLRHAFTSCLLSLAL